MADVVLFGRGLSARLAHYYLSHDSDHRVVAFTVDPGFVAEGELSGLPVVPFDEVVGRYPPEAHRMMVALGYGRMNRFREERYHDAKALGYELISYVSSRASRWPDTEVGDNCFIMEGNTVQPFVRIGNDVTLGPANCIGHDCVIGDHTFIASHADVSGLVTIGPRCFIGANSTIRNEVIVAADSIVGAGAVVMDSTTEGQVLAGTRARLIPLRSDKLPRI